MLRWNSRPPFSEIHLFVGINVARHLANGLCLEICKAASHVHSHPPKQKTTIAQATLARLLPLRPHVRVWSVSLGSEDRGDVLCDRAAATLASAPAASDRAAAARASTAAARASTAASPRPSPRPAPRASRAHRRDRSPANPNPGRGGPSRPSRRRSLLAGTRAAKPPRAAADAGRGRRPRPPSPRRRPRPRSTAPPRRRRRCRGRSPAGATANAAAAGTSVVAATPATSRSPLTSPSHLCAARCP